MVVPVNDEQLISMDNQINRQERRTMKTKTNTRGGGIQVNHNGSMKIRSNVKAGGSTMQHNERLMKKHSGRHSLWYLHKWQRNSQAATKRAESI
jgi:hypothetical protein